MSYNIDQLNSFGRTLVEQYNESTKLPSVSNLTKFSKAKRVDRDFVQLGKRSNLPKDIFNDESTVMKPLTQKLIDSITTGEEVNILSTISATAESESGDVGEFDISEFTFESVIVDSFEHVYEPDYIYIPNNKDFRTELLDWQREGHVKSKDDGLYVAGATDMKVNWMPSRWNIDDIIIFNSSDINIVQKSYSDADVPQYITPVDGFDAAESEDRLMVYLGEQFEDSPDEFELLIRSIISEPEFTGYMPSAACVGRLPEDDLV